MSISQYEALQLLSKAQDTSQPPVFNNRTRQTLTDFSSLIEELIARSNELKVIELFDLAVERSGYKAYILSGIDEEERWENVLELRTLAQQYRDFNPQDGLTSFLEGVTLVSDVDELDQTVDAVTLITLHQAKGLEFPVVFIVGMEDGILPHFKSIDDPAQLEEERRLCYVGVTRAKQRVYLVRAFRRSLMGSSMVTRPSRFLNDIPPHLIQGGGLWSGEASQISRAVYSWNQAPAPSTVGPQLKTGDHVRHAQFGEGVVVSSQPARDDTEVVVAFSGVGVKKLLLSFAHLEKIE
jgi:DNA helicase-2/ATP-dependent DNA helicase PcrA